MRRHSMNGLVCWMGALMLCTLGVGGIYAQDITSDLEGYWNFDEYDGGDAEDLSGNGRDAFVENGQPLPAAGKKGNGIFLDGNSGFQTDWEGVLGNDPRTIALWVKTTDVGDGVVGWGDTADGLKWHFRVNNSTNQPDETVVGSPRTEYQGSQTIAEGTVHDGEWHFIVSVFEGLYPTDVVHYIDGELSPTKWIGDETLEINTTTSSPEANVTIGSRVQGGSYDRITGWLDEVRIYSRALSVEDIQALYDEAKAPQSVAMRSFDKGFAAASKPVKVTLDIPIPKAGELVEELPDGWSASDISDGGTADGNVITWNLTESVTSVSYTAAPDADATDNIFSGTLDGLITDGDVLVTLLESGVGDFDFQADIGDVGAEGQASLTGNEYSVVGSGADIWGTADGFHFLFNEVEGPFTMKGNAFIIAFDFGGHDWMKGGLMIRNNLTAGSSYGYNMIRGADQQLTSQARTAQGNSALTVEDLTDDQFGDMEIQRVGKLIQFFRIDAAGERQPHGEVVLDDLEDPVYAGLATTSHSNGDLAQLLFLDLEIELDPFSASRSITQFETGRFGFGDSAEVNIEIYVRNEQSVTVTEVPPEGWAVSAIQTSVGEASVDGSGEIVWETGDLQGSATLTYTVTSPEDPTDPTMVGTFSGTLDDMDIAGDSELTASGYLSLEALADEDITSDLEAYWSFDEFDGTSTPDMTDNGYDATVVEGEPVLTDDAIKGQALEFDNNAYLNVPWTGVQGDTPRTIALWTKFSTDNEDGPIFVAWGNNIEGEKWHFRINDNAGNGTVGAIRTEYAGGNQTTASTPITDGEWHLIHSVFEGQHPQDVMHYVDGLFDPNTWSVKPETVINTLSDDAHNVHLGADDGGGRRIEGVMDEVRIYSRALTPRQIQRMYLEEAPDVVSVSDYMLY